MEKDYPKSSEYHYGVFLKNMGDPDAEFWISDSDFNVFFTCRFLAKKGGNRSKECQDAIDKYILDFKQFKMFTQDTIENAKEYHRLVNIFHNKEKGSD